VAALGIPTDAVKIEAVSPVQNRVSLADRHRPLRGGSGISHNDNDGWPGYCTLGINGIYNNTTGNAGFLTASHCTQRAWQHTANMVGQPTSHWTDHIAQEYADPYSFTGGYCPIPYPHAPGWDAFEGCRWSDAAFYRYLPSVRSVAWGGPTIHTTTYRDHGMPGSVIINGYLPVVRDAPYPVAGTFVNKMGAATGWTDGYVRFTCVNEQNKAGDQPPVLLLCQDAADLLIGSGDSGGPVYAKYSTYTEWIGILWGDRYDVTQNTYYSPAWNVRREFPGFSY
jgi:hypothetical protein